MEWSESRGITWSLWRARNQFIFHKTQQRPDFIRDQGLDLLKAFNCASLGPHGIWSLLFIYRVLFFLFGWSLSSLAHCFQLVFFRFFRALSDLLQCTTYSVYVLFTCFSFCFDSIKLSIIIIQKKKILFSKP